MTPEFRANLRNLGLKLFEMNQYQCPPGKTSSYDTCMGGGTRRCVQCWTAWCAGVLGLDETKGDK